VQAVTIAIGKAGITHFAQQLIVGKLLAWPALMPLPSQGS
jgi:hypothetical protein